MMPGQRKTVAKPKKEEIVEEEKEKIKLDVYDEENDSPNRENVRMHIQFDNIQELLKNQKKSNKYGQLGSEDEDNQEEEENDDEDND